MEIVAKSTFIRCSPSKLRLVANQIRGMEALKAEMVLKTLSQKAARPLLLVLKQAIGNAANNFGIKKETLKVSKLEVGEGPRSKRWRFVARGRVHPVLKRTSHVNLILEGEKGPEKKEEKAPKAPRKE
jgi:large subunit ribosomal protein L22